MSFQGHIENGTIVLDESVFLPNGTLVRIKPVTSRENTESLRPVVADNDQPHTVPPMAHAWNVVAGPILDDEIALSVDPDDYPLF